MQVTLDSTSAKYIAYGGDDKFETDLSSVLQLNASSVNVESSAESSDGYLVITYTIDIYSDDTQTLT